MDSNIYKLLDEDEEDNGEIRETYKKIIGENAKSIQQRIKDVEMEVEEEEELKKGKKRVKSKAIVGKKNRELRMSSEIGLRTKAKLDKNKRRANLRAKSKGSY